MIRPQMLSYNSRRLPPNPLKLQSQELPNRGAPRRSARERITGLPLPGRNLFDIARRTDDSGIESGWPMFRPSRQETNNFKSSSGVK